MKKQLQFILVLGLFLTTFTASSWMPFAASAQTATPTTTLQQRLDQYKKDRNIDTHQNTQGIKLRCPVAQAAMKTLQVRILSAETSHKTAYQNIADSLANLQKRLNDQAFETTTLKNVTDTYNAKVAIYTADMAAYKQAVSDAVTVDCAADPLGFAGALETARLYHDHLTPDVTDVRNYATTTVKATLDDIKQRLSSGNTTGAGQ